MERIIFLADKDLKEQLKQAAERKGLATGSYIRLQLMEILKKENGGNK